MSLSAEEQLSLSPYGDIGEPHPGQNHYHICVCVSVYVGWFGSGDDFLGSASYCIIKFADRVKTSTSNVILIGTQIVTKFLHS